MIAILSCVGAILLALAVGFGAFGAHALNGKLDAYSMEIWQKAVFYHFVHALGILIAVVLARTGVVSAAGAGRVGWLLFAGIVLFSGSLYVLALTGVRWLGAVTPLGGLSFIVGWVLLAVESFRAR